MVHPEFLLPCHAEDAEDAENSSLLVFLRDLRDLRVRPSFHPALRKEYHAEETNRRLGDIPPSWFIADGDEAAVASADADSVML